MTEDVFNRLRALDGQLAASGVNRHDRALTIINGCINEGIDRGPEIIAALACLGFNPKHAGITLSSNIQRDPVWPYWGRRDCGQYFAPEMPT
jgi:hypothetical protein